MASSGWTRVACQAGRIEATSAPPNAATPVSSTHQPPSDAPPAIGTWCPNNSGFARLTTAKSPQPAIKPPAQPIRASTRLSAAMTRATWNRVRPTARMMANCRTPLADAHAQRGENDEQRGQKRHPGGGPCLPPGAGRHGGFRHRVLDVLRPDQEHGRPGLHDLRQPASAKRGLLARAELDVHKVDLAGLPGDLFGQGQRYVKGRAGRPKRRTGCH